eukprot:42252-Eustigmatos_ZCMA.PRE.1
MYTAPLSVTYIEHTRGTAAQDGCTAALSLSSLPADYTSDRGVGSVRARGGASALLGGRLVVR